MGTGMSGRLLNDNKGLRFPAVLSWRSGIDKSLIDEMRPAFESSQTATSFAATILELHSKKYEMTAIQYDSEVLRLKAVGAVPAAAAVPFFGSFRNKAGYCGFVPSAKYFEHMYIETMESLRPYLDAEVRKLSPASNRVVACEEMVKCAGEDAWLRVQLQN